MHGSWQGFKIDISLCFFLDREIPLFRQPSDVEADLKSHDNSLVTFKYKVQSKSASILEDVSDPMTPSHSKCSCLVFAICVKYHVS